MAAVKESLNAILRTEQAQYLEALLPPSEPLLAEMEAAAAERGVPISDREAGRLLEILARASGARRILEVGTAIGYGAMRLARGAPEARVVSLDRDAAIQREAAVWLERAGVAERVELVCGEAVELLASLEAPFDLAYLDCDKRDYRRVLDLLLPRLRVGGLVVVDNLLWKGLAAGDAVDETTEAVRSFNGYLMMHPQLVSLVLPLGDGLGVAVKSRPLVSEMGGPF